MSPVETEIKLELPPSEVVRLNKLAAFRRAKAAKPVTQVSVYFDTDKLALRKNGVVFRVRRTGHRYVQTIKTAGGGLLDRNEWETELDGEEPDFGAARHTALEPLLTKKLCRQLRPVFETRVRRTTFPVNVRGSQIEVALDRGEIDTGDRAKSLSEIEIEFKNGDRAELLRVAREIARATSAEIAVKSKAQRGYELLDGEDSAAAAKPEPVVLAPNISTREAFRAIASSCVKQVIANKPALLAGNPEGVHQMRVGIRRLRAAISLFSDILAKADRQAINSELKWLTGELGPAREFEVFRARVIEPARRRHAPLMGMRRLSRDLAQKQKAAEERACNAVGSERFRHLLLNVATWLESEGRQPQADLLRERGDISIAISAAAELKRRSKKIRKRVRFLTKLDQHKRHQLRIQAKKLRYAAEFFGTVFPGKKRAKLRKSFLSTLEDMQDCLGSLNDMAVHEGLIADIAINPAHDTHAKDRSRRAFAAGVLAGHEDARINSVLAAAVASSEAFAKAKPFWK